MAREMGEMRDERKIAGMMREVREMRDTREVREAREMSEMRESREMREMREMKEMRERYSNREVAKGDMAVKDVARRRPGAPENRDGKEFSLIVRATQPQETLQKIQSPGALSSSAPLSRLFRWGTTTQAAAIATHLLSPLDCEL